MLHGLEEKGVDVYEVQQEFEPDVADVMPNVTYYQQHRAKKCIRVKFRCDSPDTGELMDCEVSCFAVTKDYSIVPLAVRRGILAMTGKELIEV